MALYHLRQAPQGGGAHLAFHVAEAHHALILGPLAALAHLRVRMPPILPPELLSAPQAGTHADPALFQPMRTLFEQALLLWLDGVVVALMAPLGTTPEAMEARHQNVE